MQAQKHEGDYLVRAGARFGGADDLKMAVNGKLVRDDRDRKSGYLISEDEEKFVRMCGPAYYRRIVVRSIGKKDTGVRPSRNVESGPFQEKYTYKW